MDEGRLVRTIEQLLATCEQVEPMAQDLMGQITEWEDRRTMKSVRRCLGDCTSAIREAELVLLNQNKIHEF